jgi:hypothetical protein
MAGDKKKPSAPDGALAEREGLLPVLMPDGATSCSVDGTQYEVAEDGYAYVQPHHFAALFDHAGTV